MVIDLRDRSEFEKKKFTDYKSLALIPAGAPHRYSLPVFIHFFFPLFFCEMVK
jgi:hypothetical protein